MPRAPAISHPLFWRDPALPHVESRRACDSRACYKAHSHPTFSIGAVDQGCSVFTGTGNGQTRLQPGTLVFVPAQCVHACNPEPGLSWGYQMLHLDAAWLQALRLESALATQVQGRLAYITRNPDTYERFTRLNDLLFSNACAHDKDAALIEFIGDHDAQAALPLANAPQRLDRRLAPLFERLEHEDADSLSLAELASSVGMGRYQLIRAFRAATGLTPHAWQLNLRINRARQWLRQGEDMADIAYRLGFADQSHFQRVFKAHAGVTPGMYRS
ncbi:AraC family transcriptional regulator [Pseudomonas rubra]|uniref:AraC family transcriptional regulator n=1 Tax=Pseudomonas rubra TaxID=2942627 RepID=A0ABT5PFF3_9PSED|nr:AraC family transcriptional regulator [Pseudomonas rubra]MDD1017041.1 AraC family transcriptional regulator [Pseudomonas rubra]MDD1037100.1 AraC family transcriptional regulator [Pseudomonas rubra]MDD1153761.1 AraC family transcriptional regulator [Pseudomonas rubra]